MDRSKTAKLLACVAAAASAALTLPPWVSLDDLGSPFRWNGLGIYIGDFSSHYSSQLDGLATSLPGWIVLIASIACAVALASATRRRWPAVVACVFAGVAFAAAVASVVWAALLVGDIKYSLGIPDDVSDRSLLNSSVLVAELATTAALAACSVYVHRSIREGMAVHQSGRM
ncbi:hypothetical protein A5779_17830 [Mycolicibacterium peregrinum]|uniref:DUF1772 domain-containing protein n=1 Tax=Mycolicibacterium peregrinum TaxID=43304 RepID=A0A1A0WDG9_MYCPR|nr:hypothetical protein A5779_17830 [Mycolicibacterium peregrinum]